MTVPRKESTIAQRVQALTLHSTGAKPPEIESVTGIKKNAFKALLRRAKDRGYQPGGRIKDEYVENGTRTGRPKNVAGSTERTESTEGTEITENNESTEGVENTEDVEKIGRAHV